jgi:hypothetical protein
MKEPKRLTRDSEDELARRLLGAGRARAPHAARERALAAASAALVTTGLAGGTAAAGGLLGRLGSAAALKWLAAVAFVGAGALGGAVLLERTSPEHGASEHTLSATARVASPAPPPSALAAPRAPEAPTEQGAPVPLPTSAPSPSSVTSVASAPHRVVPASAPAELPSGSTMREELAWLESARAALASGDAPRALSLLDRYGTQFPHPAMIPEAAVLRIEALVAAGDRPAAERAADSFLAQNPQSPYSSRVRSVVGRSNP